MRLSSRDDSQEHLERLPRGPKGETGERGGLSLLQGRAVVVLFALVVLLSASGLFWTSHEVSTEQGKWCALIVTIDQANAAAKTKPAPGTFTAQFTAEVRQLRQDLGCPAASATGGTP